MFHVNDKGDAKPCRAKQPENCRYYQGENDTRHYETVSEATEATEKRLQTEYGDNAPKKEVRYSFVKEFRKQEQEFNKDFEGIPNRFFNADLRGKYAYHDADELDMTIGDKRRMDTHRLGVRMISALSAPSDNGMSSEEAVELLEQQGFENIEELDKVSSFEPKAQRGWKAKWEDKDVVIIDHNVGTTVNTYSFRYGNEHFDRGVSWVKVDLRKIAGNSRAERKTGVNVLKTILRTESEKQAELLYKENVKKMAEELDKDTQLPENLKQELINNLARAEYKRGQIVKTLIGLEDSQLEGKNFIAQKKYIKEHGSGVARAFEDLKNIDQVHKDMAQNSKLNKYFRKIEIDNDVDPKEFAEFEKDYEEVMDKLPKIPKGQEPELRLRRLGKHKAHGVYFPHSDTVSIDIRNAGSTIHELTHQYDIRVKKNASLRKEFRDITAEYTKHLKIPAGEPESRSSYLNTPTEILSRGMENFAHFKLGIDNKLIDKTKLDNYDHAPFKNPELREKMFKFIEGLYEEDK